jgi:hypothetical protein
MPYVGDIIQFPEGFVNKGYAGIWKVLLNVFWSRTAFILNIKAGFGMPFSLKRPPPWGSSQIGVVMECVTIFHFHSQ